MRGLGAAAGLLALALLLGPAPAQAQTDPDTSGPELQRAGVAVDNRAKLRLFFDEPLDERSIPDQGAFTAKVNGTTSALATSNAVSVSGSTVTLTLASAVAETTGTPATPPTVTVSYNKAQAKVLGNRQPLRDALGNETDSFSDQAVRSNNRKPSYSATQTYKWTNSINAPVSTLVSLDYDHTRFTDPDGDAVTVSETVNRADANTGGTYNAVIKRRFWFHKSDCELANLDPPIRNPHTSTVTYRATDPYGETSDPVTLNFVLTGTSRACPEMTGAAVDGAALALTFEGTGAFTPSGLTASEFTVTADGEEVGVSAVSIGKPTTAAGVETTVVTLTLAESIWAGQTAVKVSHLPTGTLTTGRFTDHAVTVDTSNHRPTIAVADEAVLSQNAPPGQLKTAAMTVGDPDIAAADLMIAAPGATIAPADAANTLTVAVAADRPDVVKVMNGAVQMGYSTALPTGPVAYFQIKAQDELCLLESPPEALFTTTFTVTATDSDGASASREMAGVTGWEPDECRPAFGSAVVNGAELTLTFDEALDEDSVPAAGDFAVTVAGNPRTVSGVDVSGSTVVLTLSPAAGEGETVTVGYTAPESNPIRASGGAKAPAEGFSGQAVTNATGEFPTLEDAVVRNLKLTLLYNEALDTGSVPASGDFAVTVAGAARTVSGVDVSGRRVVLTLSPAVTAGQAVTVSYTKGANPIRDTHANRYEAANLDGRTVRNDVTPPRLTGAYVQDDTLTLTYSEPLDPNGTPALTEFRVLVRQTPNETGARIRVTAVAVSGSRAVLTLAEAVPDQGSVFLWADFNIVHFKDFAGNRAGDIATEESPRPVSRGAVPPTTGRTPPGGGGGGGGGGAPGGGGGGGGPTEPTASAPVAAAGADLEVDPGASVTLDGSASTDPEGDALAFAWSRVSGTAVALSGANAARASFTAPELPGALTFRLTVTDPGDLADSDDVTVTVRDLAPVFGARVPALSLVAGEAMEPVTLPAATGGNGALTYGLASDPGGLAGLTFSAATRRLSGTPGTEGSYVFTWRADDADGDRTDADAAILTFRVTVDDARTAMVRRTVRRTLGAVARRTLSSALENIGSRFAAGIPASGLTLAGETVPLGGSGVAAGTGLSCHPGIHGISDISDISDISEGSASGRTVPGPSGTGWGCGSWDRDVGGDGMLGSSAFTLTLGASGGTGGAGGNGSSVAGAPGAPLWSVWGRGDLGTFEGRPEGMRYEGELRTGWLGFDARAGSWVAGLALSHGTGEADYGFDAAGVSGTGRLETTLTALYPYGRWTLSNGLELRGVLGAGRGEARHRLDGGADERNETGDLSMWMGSVGLRHELPRFAGMDLAARAEASLARMETEAGTDYVDGLTSDSWRVRAGIEASRRMELAGDRALTPFVEAAMRRDGGDGIEGTGLEVAGGVRYMAPRLHVEARGRWLAAHTEDGAEERGVSVTARLGPGAHGRGLSLSLSPRWGAGAGGAEALWREEMPRPGEAPGGNAAALDARVGYGFGLAPYGVPGLVTPFAETSLAGDDSRRLRLGVRFEASRTALGVEFSGERREDGTGDPGHALWLDAWLRF